MYQSPAVKNTGDVDVCVCGWGESQDCSAMGVVEIYINRKGLIEDIIHHIWNGGVSSHM